MTEDFVSFELAKKLKEKGFRCYHPFAMYDKGGLFYKCYTTGDSAIYYDYDDFDERDYIAPTISQVLKWLREEKKLHIQIFFSPNGWEYITVAMTNMELRGMCKVFKSYEQAALAGIEYVLDNLI